MLFELLGIEAHAGAHGQIDVPELAGGGQVKAGPETGALAAETVVYLPRGTSYALKLAPPEKTDKSDKILVLKVSVARPGAAPAPRR